MTLKEKLQKAWENRAHIAEGLWNTYISHNQEIKDEAARRLSICEANTCGYWDSTGTSDKLLVKGKPGCTGCGCTGEYKVACMSCDCTLKELGQTPLWEAIMSREQEMDIKDKEYHNQFKK